MINRRHHQLWAPYHRRHRFPISLQLAMFIILMCGLTATLFIVRLAEDLRRQAQAPTPIPMLVEFILDPVTQKVAIGRSHRLSSLPKSKPAKPSKPYQLTQKLKGQTLSTIPLDFIDTIQGEDFEALTGGRPAGIDPRYRLEKPVAVTSFNYYPGATVSLNGSDSALLPLILPDMTPLTLTEPSPTEPAGNQTLDLLFISNGYPDSTLFNSDAQAMFNFLLTIPPFDQYARGINSEYYYNQEDLHCTRPSSRPHLITCDLYLVNLAAASHVYDSIIIIDNSNDYGGLAYLGGNIAVTYRDVNASAKQVMVHEFGHSFGGLQDEYGYGITYAEGNSVPWPNCDWSPCPKWSGYPGTACFETCAYTNLSRPTDNNSLMRSLSPENGFRFGPVSEEHLWQLLHTYIAKAPSADFDLDGDVDTLDYFHSVDMFRFNRFLPFNTVVARFGQ